MGIRVLGPMSVDDGPELGRRDRVVLTVLLLERPRTVSPDRLEDVLWPEGAPVTSAKVIQGCVARLRGMLDHDCIATTDHGYRMAHIGDVDAAAFEAGVARGRALIGLGQPDRAAHALADALSWWRGAPFADLEHWDVAAIEAARLQEVRLQAEELWVDALLASGRCRGSGRGGGQHGRGGTPPGAPLAVAGPGPGALAPPGSCTGLPWHAVATCSATSWDLTRVARSATWSTRSCAAIRSCSR